jgi:type IV pilus assembly protein PilB
MKLSSAQLYDLLVRPGYINADDFKRAEKKSREKKRDLAIVLIEEGLIKDEQLGQLIAQKLGWPFINLRTEKIDENILTAVPEVVARAKGIIAFGRDKEAVKIGMTNPSDLVMRHILEKRFFEPVKVFYITRRDWQEALGHYKVGVKQELDRLAKQFVKKGVPQKDRDSLVVKFVDTILTYAHYNKASDVHIEPLVDEAVIRFRIDGVLHTIFKIKKELYFLLIARIKILAKMRIDEHQAAQDGKFQFKVRDEKVDIRVSIVPVTGGENAVLRLLSAKVRQISLEDLGFSERDLSRVKEAIKYPHGMILVTGPTGSGKTTTIYEILKVLNRETVHIATIEDPVEYDIPGVSQIQVNSKTNLTFADGLRAIVRQDPDIIMVGEIRDRETAEIAVNSAMTGHLVLSTLHANDAATTLPRLLDMGIEPFLIATTVNVIIAQRLVRKVCQKCLVSYSLSAEEKAIIENDPSLKAALASRGKTDLNKLILYRGAGCKICAGTGYRGRIGIFEILQMDEKIKNLVISRASSQEILTQVKANGMTTMLENGIDKVLAGITTLAEVIRVVKE